METLSEIDEYIKKINSKTLVLFNDDKTSFELVIISLILACGHSREQAEQIALIVHNTGKCDIKHGYYEDLVRIRDLLISCKLICEIQ